MNKSIYFAYFVTQSLGNHYFGRFVTSSFIRNLDF
jgi:hypothetical protein